MNNFKIEQLSFQSENIFIDYLSFNVENLTDFDQIEAIGRAFEKKFSYTFQIIYQYISDETMDQITVNQSKIYFRRYSRPSWKGCIISFAGRVADNFYNYIVLNGLPWDLFPTQISLGRLDSCYMRPWTLHEEQTEENLRSFFSQCVEKPINQVNNIDANTRGIQLRLGNRKAASFYRIYANDKGLRFEVERKKKSAMEPLQNLLFNRPLIDLFLT